MKNYLFAPFKDDDEKKAEFEHLNKTWNFSGDLIVFIGQLESSYDVIISELRSKNAVAVADERIISELQAENKLYEYHIKQKDEEIESLQDQLKECVKDYDNDIKASYDLDDEHGEIIKRLEVEKDALLVANGELLQSNLKLRSK